MAGHQMLSASRIANTPPGTKDIWLSDDDGTRGSGRLVVRIPPVGRKRFYYRWPRLNGAPVKYDFLGFYSRNEQPGWLTLTQARAEARKRAALPRPDSSPPSPHRPAAASIAAASKPCLSVEALCRAYVQRLVHNKKFSARATENLFKRRIYGTDIGRRPADQVDALAFTDLLRDVLEISGEEARKLRSALHSAYAQAVGAGTDPAAPKSTAQSLIKSNPITPIKALNQFNRARKRVLTRFELTAMWRLIHPEDDDAVTMTMRVVRVDLLLGGQRAAQLVRAKREHVDLEAGTILLFDPKGNRPQPRDHLLPLTPQARAEVEWLIAHSEDVGSEFLFPSSQDCRKSVHSNTVSKLVTRLSKDLLAKKKSTDRFQYGDIRRTLETRLGGLDVPPHIRAHVQSHGLSGVQKRHYDMNDYLQQMRQALQILADYLNQLQKSGPEPTSDDARQPEPAG